MKSVIKKLVEATGPSGYETQVRNLVREEIKAFVDEITVDNLGNLIARKGQRTASGQKIMVAAHMDEIGLIVSHIDENGFARFTPVGAIRRSTALAGRVQFLNGVMGVIGAERLSDPGKAPSFDQMYIDLGVSNRADCPVQVGDMAVFERSFVDLGQRLVGKALDDRVGVALLIEVLRRMSENRIESPHELYFVFSAQEEIGARGATVAAYKIEPDLGLAVDLTPSAGTPKGFRMAVELGKGPAIKVRDQHMLSDPRVVDWMVRTAGQAGVPYQIEILESGSTEGRAIQLTRAGVLVGGLSIPARYVHSPSEMVDYGDVEHSLRLLLELLCNPVVIAQ
jgi:endoglucanase